MASMWSRIVPVPPIIQIGVAALLLFWAVVLFPFELSWQFVVRNISAPAIIGLSDFASSLSSDAKQIKFLAELTPALVGAAIAGWIGQSVSGHKQNRVIFLCFTLLYLLFVLVTGEINVKRFATILNAAQRTDVHLSGLEALLLGTRVLLLTVGIAGLVKWLKPTHQINY